MCVEKSQFCGRQRHSYHQVHSWPCQRLALDRGSRNCLNWQQDVDMMRLRVQLDPKERLASEDLTGLFLEFYAPPLNTANSGFRVWVEGDTDSRLLKLVSKLGYAAKGVDLAESLSILPLGSGRDGGTSKLPGIVVEKGTRRNRDLFVFDCDQAGRNAKEKLQILDQDACSTKRHESH